MAKTNVNTGDNQNQQQDPEVARLQAQNQQLQQRLNHLTQMINQEQEQQPQPQPQPQQQPQGYNLPPDFDQMGDRELVEWIINTVTDQVQEDIEPVKKQTQQLAQQQTVSRYQQQIQQAADKYNDFWQYSNKAAQIAKNVGGNITAEQAYLLAKSQATGLTQEEIKKEGDTKEEEQPQEQEQQEQETQPQEQASTPNEVKQFAQQKRQQPPVSEKPGEQGGEQEQGRFDRKSAIEEALNRLNK